MRVIMLTEATDLVAVYEDSEAGRAAAAADLAHLHAQARSDWASGTWRSARQYSPPQAEVVRVDVRTTPRLAQAQAPQEAGSASVLTVLWDLAADHGYTDQAVARWLSLCNRYFDGLAPAEYLLQDSGAVLQGARDLWGQV